MLKGFWRLTILKMQHQLFAMSFRSWICPWQPWTVQGEWADSQPLGYGRSSRRACSRGCWTGQLVRCATLGKHSTGGIYKYPCNCRCWLYSFLALVLPKIYRDIAKSPAIAARDCPCKCKPGVPLLEGMECAVVGCQWRSSNLLGCAIAIRH